MLRVFGGGGGGGLYRGIFIPGAVMRLERGVEGDVGVRRGRGDVREREGVEMGWEGERKDVDAMGRLVLSSSRIYFVSFIELFNMRTHRRQDILTPQARLGSAVLAPSL